MGKKAVDTMEWKVEPLKIVALISDVISTLQSEKVDGVEVASHIVYELRHGELRLGLNNLDSDTSSLECRIALYRDNWEASREHALNWARYVVSSGKTSMALANREAKMRDEQLSQMFGIPGEPPEGLQN